MSDTAAIVSSVLAWRDEMLKKHPELAGKSLPPIRIPERYTVVQKPAGNSS